MAMKALLERLFVARTRKPVFAEDENAERAMRIAEVKWLLREIAERPNAGPRYPDNDNADRPASRGRVA
jgi:hypothetical protein